MENRILTLNEAMVSGKCVVYVISRDQRVKDNHALFAAQKAAVDAKLPLIVCFNLLERTGFRRREHFAFMLDGLEKVAKDLEKLNIPFVMTHGDPTKSLPALFKELKPTEIIFDFSPLHGPRELAKYIAKHVKATVRVIDTHNVVPVWAASNKLEFAAHTLRPKIHRQLEGRLVEPEQINSHPHSFTEDVSGISFTQARKLLTSIPSSGIHISYDPGEAAAMKHLKKFIKGGLLDYAQGRNNPSDDKQSGLSPYLHFGQVSSLRVALEVLYAVNERPLLFDQPKMAQAGESPSKYDGMNALFEEMIIRKELSDNFCLYASSYTSLESAADWANTTLSLHEKDVREFTYSRSELENAKTHDNAWNAAQKQLTKSGKMHGYMRMYWAKKILEWSPNPKTALETSIYLNDTYSIDGGDPSGYVGMLWSIAGIHDRPWTERPVFGKIRYMNEAGLRRKFDIDLYIAEWNTKQTDK